VNDRRGIRRRHLKGEPRWRNLTPQDPSGVIILKGGVIRAALIDKCHRVARGRCYAVCFINSTFDHRTSAVEKDLCIHRVTRGNDRGSNRSLTGANTGAGSRGRGVRYPPVASIALGASNLRADQKTPHLNVLDGKGAVSLADRGKEVVGITTLNRDPCSRNR